MAIQPGEVYGKQTSSKLVMYNVIKVKKTIVTLQNIDNPLSLFEITVQKLSSLGYVRLSQKPYIDTAENSKRKKFACKPTRCPHTLDFVESRADSERPAPILPDLFS